MHICHAEIPRTAMITILKTPVMEIIWIITGTTVEEAIWGETIPIETITGTGYFTEDFIEETGINILSHSQAVSQEAAFLCSSSKHMLFLGHLISMIGYGNAWNINFIQLGSGFVEVKK
ncbi:MAG: hypothetical protein Q8891_05330 [Bacteroidota bacterium]|nr:hypothetical protein [Bacteroidota bacterium]